MTTILWLAFLLFGQVPQAGKGTIYGRVLQPDGQPASRMTVELVKASRYAKGLRIFEPVGQSVEIGENGEYRMEVASGEYYIRTVTTPGGPQARTYFPNTSNPAEAKSIVVAKGDDVSADIRLSTTPVFKITGRIVDLLPDRENHYPTGVSLHSNSPTVRETKLVNPYAGYPVCCSAESVPDPNVSVSITNDRFEILGVRPGTYDLTAGIVVADSKADCGFRLIKPGEKPPSCIIYGGRTTVDVTNSDIEDIRVEVRHGADLTGRIVSNGKRVNTDDANFFLRGPDINSPIVVSVRKNGQFFYPNLLDGTYTLDPLGLPINAYLVEIREGGRKLSGLDITINRTSPEPVEIIMNPSPGQIDGQVPGSNAAVIVLVPLDDPTRYVPLPVRRLNPDGKFMFRGLGPGQYRIYAFRSSSDDIFSADSITDFVHPYEAQGTLILVKPGSQTSVKLTAIDL